MSRPAGPPPVPPADPPVMRSFETTATKQLATLTPQAAAQQHVGEPLFVLSLNGGGSRGVLTAAFLQAMEEDFHQHGWPDFAWHRHVHVMAGTSIGGAIALALGRARKSARQVADTATDEAIDRAMRKSWLDRMLGVVQFRPKYRGAPKLRLLRQLLSCQDNSFYRHPTDVTTRHDGPVVCVPAFRNAVGGGAQLFTTDRPPPFGAPSRQLALCQVADATSAAPAYFPSPQIYGSHYLDGGVYANNPALAGVAQAARLRRQQGTPFRQIRLLSVATGAAESAFDGGHERQDGGVQWLLQNDLFGRAMVGQQQYTVQVCQDLLGADHAVQCNTQLPEDLEKLDVTDPEKLARLRQLGRTMFQTYRSRVRRLFGFPA